jgi:hypothetical protein
VGAHLESRWLEPGVPGMPLCGCKHCEYSTGAVLSLRTFRATAPLGVWWGGVLTEAAAADGRVALERAGVHVVVNTLATGKGGGWG